MRYPAPSSRAQLARPFLELLEERLAPAGLVGDLVVFGDSLADQGNVSLATSGTIPGPLYSQGRYSNGPLWVNTLAEYLGEASPRPSALGGLDFAFGGATVALPTANNPFGTPSIAEQIGLYGLAGNVPDAMDVFALWAGANDFFFSNGALSPVASANALADAVQSLITAGGRHFVVANLPPLGDTPYFQDGLEAGAVTQAAVDGANAWAAGFNTVLAQRLAALDAQAGVDIVQLDIPAILNELKPAGNPLGLTDFDDAVGPYNPTTGFLTSITAADQSKFLYFDSVHPGTQTHQYIGLAAAAGTLSNLGINTLYVTSTSDVIAPTDGQLSLREVLNVTNRMPGVQTVGFGLGTELTTVALNQEILISDDTNLVSSWAGYELSGRNQNRIFNISQGADVVLSGLTLRDGNADRGGAIYNAGNLQVVNSFFLNNHATGVDAAGGVIFNRGQLQVSWSLLWSNSAVGTNSAHGGALAGAGAGTGIAVAWSVLLGNLAEGPFATGGGIDAGPHTVVGLTATLLHGNAATGNPGTGGGVNIAPGALLGQLQALLQGNSASTAGPDLFVGDLAQKLSGRLRTV